MQWVQATDDMFKEILVPNMTATMTRPNCVYMLKTKDLDPVNPDTRQMG